MPLSVGGAVQGGAACGVGPRVSEEQTLWERIDEPVLRWVASLPSPFDIGILKLATREPEPFEDVPGIDTFEAHESLMRLSSHGLVDGDQSGTIGYRLWGKLRITAQGLIVLGEWPDLDRVATAAALHRLLRAMSDEAPEEARSVLRRAAGVVARTADDVVRGTAVDVARTLGREVAGG